MNKCGKPVKNLVNNLVERIWKKVVGKSQEKCFPHNKKVLHIGFTRKIHVVLHKKKVNFFPVKTELYTLST